MSLQPREKLLHDALARAARNDFAALESLLRRHSQFPGPKPNLIFADEVALALESQPDQAYRVAEALLAHHPGVAPGGTESEFLPIVGLLVAVAAVPAAEFRAKKRELPELSRTLKWVHDASDDLRFHVRDCSVLALSRLFPRHEGNLWGATEWFVDGYFPAATYVRTLTDRKVVDGLADRDAAKELLERVIELLLNASRSDLRYPGYKELLGALPAAAILLASRFGAEMLEPLLACARSKSPGHYEAVLKVAQHTQIRSRFADTARKIEAARNEAPKRIDPRNERLKKKPRR